MSLPLLYLDTSAWLKLYVEEEGSDHLFIHKSVLPQLTSHLNPINTVQHL